MVFVTPPRNAPNASLSNQLGNGISQGFLSSAQPAINQQYQRGELQKALEGMKGIANDPNATPYDIASALISSTSQIPGSERYVGQLYDSLMRSRQTKDFFGDQGKQQAPSSQFQQNKPQQRQQPQNFQSGGIGSQGNINPLMNRSGPSQQPSPLMQNQGNQQAFQQGNGETPSLNTMSPEEIDVEARRQAQALNDPNYYGTALKNLESINELKRKQQSDAVNTQALETARQKDILDRDTNLRNFTQPKLKTNNPEEINDFMLIGQRYDNLKNNPAAWYDATKRDFDAFMNSKTALDNSSIPGMGKGQLRKGVRESELKRLDPIVKNLVKYGKEDYARNKLASLYLSPTEIEERIHPINSQSRKNIETLPRAPYESFENLPPTSFKELGSNVVSGIQSAITGKTSGKMLKSYDELLESNPKIIDQSNQKLSSFLKNNISNDSSLLVLRDNLVNKKGYDWRQFSDALEMAQNNGLELTPRQEAELSGLTRPPVQSLPNLFNEWGNWIDYLRGNK